ncbi:hypothetical protein F9222_26265, partial [Escherichia coli]
MKKASDRILKRSVLSVLLAAALYTPQVMAFTDEVNDGVTVKDETVENGTQYVQNNGKTENIAVGEKGTQYVYFGGETENTVIGKGGKQYIEGTATNTTIGGGGMQIVYAGGTATGTTIEKDGLMQSAGEDSGTTVKGGGVYELGRVATGDPDSPYGYYGLSSALDLKVEAGGRAEVYAGTLTGAKVSGANASLTLMTPQTETADGDLTLSLTGQVSVTEGGRLVSQRGADMSGAELTLSSQGGLILKGDT